MSHHELKCWPEAFDLVAIGLKTFEIRVNDRGFLPGDGVELRRWDPSTARYTGQRLTGRIGHVVTGRWGLPPELCVFSLLDVEVKS